MRRIYCGGCQTFYAPQRYGPYGCEHWHWTVGWSRAWTEVVLGVMVGALRRLAAHWDANDGKIVDDFYLHDVLDCDQDGVCDAREYARTLLTALEVPYVE